MVLLAYLLRPGQRFQSVSPQRLLQRPHHGGLLYEERGFCSWQEFEQATRDFREEIAALVPQSH
jgi:hypothetical protein